MTLRVGVYTTTRFWLLDLAQQLHLRDVLGHFFTRELPPKKYAAIFLSPGCAACPSSVISPACSWR
jgi:hypothetical protein